LYTEAIKFLPTGPDAAIFYSNRAACYANMVFTFLFFNIYRNWKKKEKKVKIIKLFDEDEFQF